MSWSSQLIDEGKAYARAEIGLAKAIAGAKAKALAMPAAMFGAAFICALAAVTALAVGVVIALAKFIGPLAAGFVGMLIFAAIAGGLGWYGARAAEARAVTDASDIAAAGRKSSARARA